MTEELGPKEQPNSCAIFNYEIVFFCLVASPPPAAAAASSSFYCYYFCCTCFVFRTFCDGVCQKRRGVQRPCVCVCVIADYIKRDECKS